MAKPNLTRLTLHTLVSLTVILPQALPAQAQIPGGTSYGFMDWLLRRGGPRSGRRPPGWEQPPAGSRGEICLISLRYPEENTLWHQRPVFIVGGRLGGVGVSEGDRILWRYSIPQPSTPTATPLTIARYDGPDLQPGKTYTLLLYDALAPNADTHRIDFHILSGTARRTVDQDLESLTFTAVTHGQTVTTLIEQRADYFWQRGLTSDAWQELGVVAVASPQLAEALAAAVQEVCLPPEVS